MALKVGELYGLLELDTAPFDKGVSGVKGAMGKLGGVVAGTMAGIATAIGGAMVGAVMKADEYKKALNGLQTQTNATSKDMSYMGDAMKRIYGNNFGESMGEIANTMAYAQQATGAYGEELEYLTQDALMLRDTFAIDMNDSLRGAGQMMKEFGLTGTEAMSMIAEGTQKGLNKSDDLIDTIDEYSVYFKTAGFSAQDMFAMMESASAAGVRNLDFVGDAMKEFVIKTKDGSKTTVDAFESLGFNADAMGAKLAAGGEKGREAFLKTMEALNKVKDPLEKNRIGVELFGTKFEDLEAEAIEAMGNLNGTIKGSVDVLDKINEIKYDDFGSAMAGIGRQLQVGLLLPFGEKLLPILNDFANWISGNIPRIVAFFTDMGGKSSGVFNKIKSVIAGAMEYILPIIMDTIQTAKDWWNKNGSTILSQAQNIFNGIVAVVKFAMPFVRYIIKYTFEAVTNIISGAFQAISGLVDFFAGLFTGDFSRMWSGVKDLFVGAIKLIWGLMSISFVRGLLNLVKTLGKGIASGFTSMWNAGVTIFNNLVKNILTSAGNMAKGVGTWFMNLFNQARTIFSMLRQFGEGVFRAFLNTIRSVASNIYTSVRTAFTNMASSVRTKVNEVWTTAKTIFGKIRDAITNPIETAKKGVNTAIEEIKGFFTGLKLELPKIKMPKFGIKNWSKNPADWLKAMPSLTVDWYAKGGIFTGPTIAGIGEAGPEAVVPLAGKRMKPFAQEIARQMGGTGGANEIYLKAALVMPDGRVIAEIAEPHIQEIQDMNTKKKKRGWGAYS